MPEEASQRKKSAFIRFRDYLMKTTNGMAIGLFGTLIIATILDLLAKIPHMEGVLVWTAVLKSVMGAGIGLGVALALKKDGVTAVTLMAAGLIGNYAFVWTPYAGNVAQWDIVQMGDPLSCYVAAVLAEVALRYVMRKKTPVDLLLIPLLGIGTAMLYSFLAAEWVHYVTIGLSIVIEKSFAVIPFLMCIVISVLVGMALTAPISSVAICVAIQIGGVPLAAASALIGCCVQMVGFAVHTARDNKWGSVLAVGIGTSMLQFKNIVRKPIVWLPTIIASALLGPLAMLFPLENATAATKSALSVGAGMGTSGLVGPINFLSALGFDNWLLWVLLVAIIVGGGLLVFGLDCAFRAFHWIEKGDYSLKSEM
ncbi:MAG: PTS sugar transporter subunit IIC [Bacilli bacterium]|nr:PTS sugar transporter subunit IIC [Bacilli bacterium]